jgi:hypothetical protein
MDRNDQFRVPGIVIPDERETEHTPSTRRLDDGCEGQFEIRGQVPQRHPVGRQPGCRRRCKTRAGKELHRDPDTRQRLARLAPSGREWCQQQRSGEHE